jgi:hypothetical protein
MDSGRKPLTFLASVSHGLLLLSSGISSQRRYVDESTRIRPARKDSGGNSQQTASRDQLIGYFMHLSVVYSRRLNILKRF